MIYSATNLFAYHGNVMYWVRGMFNSQIIYSAETVATTNTDWWSADLHRHGMNMGYSGN